MQVFLPPPPSPSSRQHNMFGLLSLISKLLFPFHSAYRIDKPFCTYMPLSPIPEMCASDKSACRNQLNNTKRAHIHTRYHINMCVGQQCYLSLGCWWHATCVICIRSCCWRIVRSLLPPKTPSSPTAVPLQQKKQQQQQSAVQSHVIRTYLSSGLDGVAFISVKSTFKINAT